MLLGMFLNIVKLHISEIFLLGKNQFKQMIKFFLHKSHTGMDIASLMCPSIVVDSHLQKGLVVDNFTTWKGLRHHRLLWMTS